MAEICHIESDVQLWRDFRLGNDEACKVIYNSYIQSLFRYGCHFTHDRDLVKDCIQDLFVDLHNYRGGLSSTDNIKLYLFKSLKHKIVNALSKVKRYKDDGRDDLSFNYDISFEEEIEANEEELQLMKRLSNAFSRLSQRQKEAVYLKFVSGLNYDEIGRLLNLKYQSARNLVFRSLEKLRKSHSRMLGFLILQVVNFINCPEFQNLFENIN